MMDPNSSKKSSSSASGGGGEEHLSSSSKSQSLGGNNARPVKPSKSVRDKKRKAPEVPPAAVKNKKRNKKTSSSKSQTTKTPEVETTSMEKKFQRLWTKEDEIHLLEHLNNHIQSNNGIYPTKNDANLFHDFVKGSLSFDVTISQLVDKLRKLKAKFRNNVVKFHTKQVIRTMSDAHKIQMFDLSHKLWGAEDFNNFKIKTTKHKGKKSKTSSSDEGVAAEDYVSMAGKDLSCLSGASEGFLLTGEKLMKMALDLLSGDKKVEVEGKWNDLKVQELKLYLNKLDFLKEQAQDLLNATMEGRAS